MKGDDGMTEITIHGFAPSTYTRSARMAAIELGIDHKLVPIVYGSPEHFALHPFGKMPIMTHGETVVFETLAIMTWLDELSPKSGLFGYGRQERTDIQQLISVALDYAYQPVVHVRLENGAPDPD
jgi:glutathione S-transferase